MPSLKKKEEDYIKNYYHININYVYKVILTIIKDIDNFNYNKLIKKCICNLKEINNNIDRTNLYLVDEYIFGIFANIYIIEDIYKFFLKRYVDKNSSEYIKEYEQQYNIINCEKDKYKLKLNEINLFKDDILSILKLFLTTIYPNHLTQLENKERITLLWVYYIRNIIIKEFNNYIYIKSEEIITSLDIENLHYVEDPNKLIDFTNISNQNIIKSPFDYFDNFINYNFINYNKISKEKIRATCLSLFSRSRSRNITTDIICDNLEGTNNIYNGIIYYLKYLLLYSLNTDKHIENLDDKYITINQYGKICWFIAILNGICYSDLHRQLILNTKDNIPKNNYSNFIIEIIDKLSSKQTKIKEIKECSKEIYDLLYSFKNKPIELLKSSVIEYIDAKKDNIDMMISNPKIYEYDYFINMIKDNYEYINKKIYDNKYSNIKDFIENKGLYDHFIKIITNKYLGIIGGIYDQQKFNTLKYIYNKLGLKTVCLEVEKHNERDDIINIYKLTENLVGNEGIDETNAPVPGDILVLKNYNNDNTNKIKYSSSLITKHLSEDNLIYYNGVEYILDYILISSSFINYGIGSHDISGIKYQNKKYVYDGGLNIYKHKFKDFAINCSLIQYDWNENIFKNNTSCIFNKYLCDIIDAKDDDVYILRNLPYEDRFCFYNSNNIYIYIKKE
jgi:hypothetical protein